MPTTRLIRIFYQLVISITLGGKLFYEKRIPLKITTKPSREAIVQQPNPSGDGAIQYQLVPVSKAASAVFRAPVWARSVSVRRPNEEYICPMSDLTHVDRYPFWVGLSNASKLSKEIGVKIAEARNKSIVFKNKR